MQPSDTISPLRPVSLSLLQDTVAALPTDAQEFLFSESDINLLNVSTNELRNSNTSVNSGSDSRKESPFQENSVTMHNHLGTMDLAKLDVRRSSGPYDNLPKTKHEMTMNLDIDNAQSKADNQRKASNSSQNWVSFN